MPHSYLRRFKKKHCTNGVFTPEAFECTHGELGLSFHIRKPPLETGQGILEYQAAFAYDSGDKLGICELSAHCFTGMNRPIPKKPTNHEEQYGEHHRELTPCPSDDQAAQLALCARKLLDFVKH